MPIALGASLAVLLGLAGGAVYLTRTKWRGAARLRDPND
jgi:hypothetical protein